MENYSLEQRSIFDKPYFSINIADLSLLESLRKGLQELEGVKHVNISDGKRKHLTIYGESYVDVKEILSKIKGYLDTFDDTQSTKETSEKEQMTNPAANFAPPVPQYKVSIR